jgi:hypothetical protein
VARYRLYECCVPAVEMAGVEEVWAVGLGPILNYNRPYRLVFAVVLIIMAVMLAASCGAIDLVGLSGLTCLLAQSLRDFEIAR